MTILALTWREAEAFRRILSGLLDPINRELMTTSTEVSCTRARVFFKDHPAVASLSAEVSESRPLWPSFSVRFSSNSVTGAAVAYLSSPSRARLSRNFWSKDKPKAFLRAERTAYLPVHPYRLSILNHIYSNLTECLPFQKIPNDDVPFVMNYLFRSVDLILIQSE